MKKYKYNNKFMIIVALSFACSFASVIIGLLSNNLSGYHIVSVIVGLLMYSFVRVEYYLENECLIHKNIFTIRRMQLTKDTNITLKINSNNVAFITFINENEHIQVSSLIAGNDELVYTVCKMLETMGKDNCDYKAIMEFSKRKFKWNYREPKSST